MYDVRKITRISPSRKWIETENNKTSMNHEFYLDFQTDVLMTFTQKIPGI